MVLPYGVRSLGLGDVAPAVSLSGCLELRAGTAVHPPHPPTGEVPGAIKAVSTWMDL